MSQTPWVYRDYIWDSLAEFSTAKNAYVATESGWFSCRTACYLASGRPAVVQDTGYSRFMDVGEGVLACGGDAPTRPARQTFTTVLSWQPAQKGPLVGGVQYGGKNLEFEKMLDLPQKTTAEL